MLVCRMRVGLFVGVACLGGVVRRVRVMKMRKGRGRGRRKELLNSAADAACGRKM